MFIFQLFAQLRNPVIAPEFQNPVRGVEFVNNLLPNIVLIGLVIGVTVFFFMFMIGALEWIFSGGDRDKVEDARKRITNALTGLLILLLIFVIIHFINLILNINIGGLGIGSDSYQQDCSWSGSCQCLCQSGYQPVDTDACSNLTQDQCTEDAWCMCERIGPTATPELLPLDLTAEDLWRTADNAIGVRYCNRGTDTLPLTFRIWLQDYNDLSGDFYESPSEYSIPNPGECAEAVFPCDFSTIGVGQYEDNMCYDLEVRAWIDSADEVDPELDECPTCPYDETYNNRYHEWLPMNIGLGCDLSRISCSGDICLNEASGCSCQEACIGEGLGNAESLGLDANGTSGQAVTQGALGCFPNLYGLNDPIEEGMFGGQCTYFGETHDANWTRCNCEGSGGWSGSPLPPITPTSAPIPVVPACLPPGTVSIGGSISCSPGYIMNALVVWSSVPGATSYRIEYEEITGGPIVTNSAVAGVGYSISSMYDVNVRVRVESSDGTCIAPSGYTTDFYIDNPCGVIIGPPPPTSTPIPTITPAPTATNTPPVPTPTPYYLTCVGSTCQAVAGSGFSSCATDFDCIPPTATPTVPAPTATPFPVTCTGPAPGIVINSATGLNCTNVCNSCFGGLCDSVGLNSAPAACGYYCDGLAYMDFGSSICSFYSVSCNFNMNVDPSGLLCTSPDGGDTRLRNWTYCNCLPSWWL